MRPLRPLVPLLLLLTGAVAFSSPASASQPGTWNFTQADVTAAAQAAGNQGRGITVAVIDTWVEASHSDFGGRVLNGADCSSGSCTPGLAAADGCDPHGTHVSGTIASATYGVAPGATILPLRVLAGSDAASCSASTTAVSAAIDYAVAHSARVINLSLGDDSTVSASSTILSNSVTKASNAGVVVVFAAGNSSKSSAATYGGHALIVAATGPSGSIASYSDHGTGVNLAAPGGDVGSSKQCTVQACVVSTWSNGMFAALEGTSMAAPHVSGAAALLFAQDPSRTAAQVVAILEGKARPLSGAGSGLLDVQAALNPTAAQQASASAAPAASAPPVVVPVTHAPVVVTSKAPTPAAAPAKTSAAPTSASPAVSPSQSPAPLVLPPDSVSPTPAPASGDPELAPVVADAPGGGSKGLPAGVVGVGLLTLVASGGGWLVAFRRAR